MDESGGMGPNATSSGGASARMGISLSFAATVLLLVALLAGFSVPSALATNYYWDNNGSTAGFGTASGTWAVPTTGNASQGWSTSSAGTVVPGNVTTTSADDVNFGTASLALGTGTVTVSGNVTNNTITFATNSTITLSGGTIVMAGTLPAINGSAANTVISNAILLLATTTINAPNEPGGGGTTPVPLTLSGPISGTAGVIFNGVQPNNAYGTINLNASSTYTGTTRIDTSGSANTEIFVKLGVDNALPVTTVLTLDGGDGTGSGRFCDLNLNGNDQTLAGLTSVAGLTLRTQRINNTSGSASRLTVNNTASYVFAGDLVGNLSLVKSGAGALTLSGNNTYSGTITISAGTLEVGGAGELGNGSYAGNITNNAAFDFSSSATQTLSGVITGSGTLTNSGSGTLTITGTNTLPRNFVSSGVLSVSGGGNVSGSVTASASGTLRLTGGGRVNTVTVNSGGIVNLPGTGTATNLTFASTGAMSFNFNTTNTVGTLTVTTASGITNNGAANSITINLTGSVPADGTYTLIAYNGTLLGSGFSAYQLGTVPFGKTYALVNTAGAVQVMVGAAPNFVRVETKADGTGVAVPDSTVLTGTSLTNYAIYRTGSGVFITNTAATWSLTNVTGAVVASNLVAAVGGKNAVFKPMGVGSARILATVPTTNAVPSGTITSISLTTRPFIWVRNTEKAGILAKIATNAWATSIFNGMVSRAAADLASHQTDRDAFLRGLPVNWNAAPTPTFNIGGGSYNTGEAFFNTALDCAVLFYLTGDTNYARCAADILHNSVLAYQNLAPSTSTGNGGWLIPTDFLYEARQVGCQLPVVYDFLYAYLQANQVYDVDTTNLVNFSFTNAQNVFRTYYELARDHGQLSNWSALESTCMLNSLLALDSSSERAAALQVYLTTGSSRQSSLSDDYAEYTQPGIIWPESLQYSGAVGQIRSTHMVLIERYDPALNLFGVYSNLPTSLPRISYLVYPNTSMQISFGDGHRDAGGQPYFRYELMYQHALARGRTNLTSLFGSLINGGVAAGSYNRSTLSDYSKLGQHDEPLELLWSAATITEPAVVPELPRTDTLPFAGIALQRNPSTVNDSTYGLMGFVGGAQHIHSHASGMSMELFGLGQVMGAKVGPESYGTPIHENYCRLFSANNTVVVNAASQGSGGWEGLGINTVAVVAMEPQPFAAAVSSNFSFTCSSFADNMGTVAEGTQQRTLSIIRTSPTNGFYVDFFRSKSTVSNRVATTLNGNVTNQFHDYIYHNVGSTNISLTTNDVTLPLVSQSSRFQNDIGDAYDQPGWRYFANTVVSYPHNQPTRVQFTATPSGTPLYMDMLIAAVTNREYARVVAPPIVDYNSTADSPAIVVRQIGDAWDKPFAVVFEPHYSATGSTVTNATALWRGNIMVGLEIEGTVAGKSTTHYVFSNPNATESYTNAALGLIFKGRFGVVADNGDGTASLYLGQGSSLSYRGNSVNVVGGTNSQAEVRFTPGQSPVITANAPVSVVSASAPQFTQITPPVGGVIALTATGSMGVPYRLWGTTNLGGGTWTVLNTGVVTNSPFVIQDGGAVSNATRFYRLSTP